MDEENASNKFRSKSRKILNPGGKNSINGSAIDDINLNVYCCRQTEKMNNLEIFLNIKDTVKTTEKLRCTATSKMPGAVSPAQLLTATPVQTSIGDSHHHTLRGLQKIVKGTIPTAS